MLSRRQKVAVGEAVSTWAEVLSGVPLGSVLGPVLFVCYINGKIWPHMVRSLIFLYADDAKICCKVSCQNDLEQLQSDLNCFGDWSHKWQLQFNLGKCKVMHFGKRPLSIKYYMQDCAGNSHTLQETTEEKDLGIWTDPSLKFSVHIAYAVKKANQILGLIRRSFIFLDITLMKQLYTVMVRPHLEYGNIVWHPQFNKKLSYRRETARQLHMTTWLVS